MISMMFNDVVLPSLPPFWLNFEMLSMCLLFCFVIFWMLCCIMCEKKKKVDNKKNDVQWLANDYMKIYLV